MNSKQRRKQRRADKPLFLWTDYPFEELGDVAHTIAPIRQVELLAWDGDKYCIVKYNDRLFGLKRWYLYLKEERLSPDNSAPVKTISLKENRRRYFQLLEEMD